MGFFVQFDRTGLLHVRQKPEVAHPIKLRAGSDALSLFRFQPHLDGRYRSYPQRNSVLREALSRFFFSLNPAGAGPGIYFPVASLSGPWSGKEVVAPCRLRGAIRDR